MLQRDPYREITTVVKITDHDPQKVWREMDEYVPTETIKGYSREILDVLLDTRRGATERVCIWVSGFFGSGKSHFLKALGYLLEDRPLRDNDGQTHSSSELLSRKLGVESFLPLLTKEFRVKVIYINLLDCDPQNPRRPTFSRLIYRDLLREKGLSPEFWVAAWETEIQSLGKWEEFRRWVQENFGRSWEDERRLNAETVLRKALADLFPDRYRDEEAVGIAIRNSKESFSGITPSQVVQALRDEAERLNPTDGRLVVLLDEVGLYIGDSVERLTDLNSLAEQVVQGGEGKVLLIATAQEALTEMVSRLTSDRQMLEWLRDRFRVHLGLQPTEVQIVIAQRLLAKTPQGASQLSDMYRSHQGNLLSALLPGSHGEREFVEQYPLHPYAVELIQNIMGAMRGSIEEARKLSGSERSMLKLTQAILTGEGGITEGAEQEVGWLVPLDLFYDALKPDLQSEQVRLMEEIEKLGDINGLPIVRIAKALFLLQHLRARLPCSVENLSSTLVDRVDVDFRSLKEKVKLGLQKLQEKGWVVEEEGGYRLLTQAEHALERNVRENWPTPAELQKETVELIGVILRDFRYEHGTIRRRLDVSLSVDGEPIREGELKVELFTPFADLTEDEILERSVLEPETIFWKAGEEGEIRRILERVIAVKKTLNQWRHRSLTSQQEEYRSRIDRETRNLEQVRLPELIRRAFLRGKLLIAGSEVSPSGTDISSVLRHHLREIADRLYTEFIDRRPAREEECAAILNWSPGTALPSIYVQLNLISNSGRISHDSGLLATVKAELDRRKRMGADLSGRALTEHFEKAPYGWDPRLLRLFIATLFKAGLVGVKYQNRLLTDPTDPQACPIFAGTRDFQRATFELLPEVDWRRASELCSSIFSVQGGDTFERTAAIVGEQAQRWGQEARQLAIRCRDNGLPDHFDRTCEEISNLLAEISQRSDPNARLRQFLEIAEMLSEKMRSIRELKDFPFDGYRRVRRFTDATEDWASFLSGEAQERRRLLRDGLTALDLPNRWGSLKEDYSFLLDRYRSDYAEAHRRFQEAVHQALEMVRGHEAFQYKPDEAERLLEPIQSLICDASDPMPDEDTFRCPICRRSLISLEPSLIQKIRREVEDRLNALIPPTDEFPKPLSLRRVLEREGDLDELFDELRRYLRRVNRPVRIRVDARVKED
ncbi:BREX system P-loop protein BrxC [Candidatus Poribacteria bacterium]|nr:BREX system P-loop protein BrxC [Candidatus Poribacteria bacterium]